MKRIGQKTWLVIPLLPKQDGGKNFREKFAGEAENLYFGEQGNFARQNCMMQHKKKLIQCALKCSML